MPKYLIHKKIYNFLYNEKIKLTGRRPVIFKIFILMPKMRPAGAGKACRFFKRRNSYTP
jgi:hypothetical protein